MARISIRNIDAWYPAIAESLGPAATHELQRMLEEMADEILKEAEKMAKREAGP